MSTSIKFTGPFSLPIECFTFGPAACFDPLAPLPEATQTVNKTQGPCNTLGNAQIADSKYSESLTGPVTKLYTWFYTKNQQPAINQSFPIIRLLLEFFLRMLILFHCFYAFKDPLLPRNKNSHFVIFPVHGRKVSRLASEKIGSRSAPWHSWMCPAVLQLCVLLILNVSWKRFLARSFQRAWIDILLSFIME